MIEKWTTLLPSREASGEFSLLESAAPARLVNYHTALTEAEAIYDADEEDDDASVDGTEVLSQQLDTDADIDADIDALLDARSEASIADEPVEPAVLFHPADAADGVAVNSLVDMLSQASIHREQAKQPSSRVPQGLPYVDDNYNEEPAWSPPMGMVLYVFDALLQLSLEQALANDELRRTREGALSERYGASYGAAVRANAKMLMTYETPELSEI